MKKGIIFDMDGTLWDSAAEVAESWNETVKRAGYDRKPRNRYSGLQDDGRRTPETSGTVWGRRK